MLTVLYTNTDALRSLVGVTESEWEDHRFQEGSLEKDLRLWLNDWYSGHKVAWDASVAPAATVPQRDMGDMLSQWCLYAGAWLMAPSLPLLVQQSLADSKTEYKRSFSTRDIATLRANLEERRAYYQNRISAVVNSSPVTVASLLPPGLGVSPLGTDPVTNGQP
jgi:hypothetical protein